MLHLTTWHCLCGEVGVCLLLVEAAFPERHVSMGAQVRCIPTLWMVLSVPCRPLTSCCCCGLTHCIALACPPRMGLCGLAPTASVTTCTCGLTSFLAASVSPVYPGFMVLGLWGRWVELVALPPKDGHVSEGHSGSSYPMDRGLRPQCFSHLLLQGDRKGL